MAQVCCQIALPAGFRADDILRFHRRDVQGFAEKVEAQRLQKGLLWQGLPACLRVDFSAALAEAELAVDGGTATAASLERLLRRLLGLDQPVAAFEKAHAAHPQLGPVLAGQSGLRVPQTATPFEALTWAITGQQISVGAAVALRRKLIAAAGAVHSGGLACYPDAARLARLDLDSLRAAGFSQSKAQTLLAVSRQVLAGELPLDDWLDDPPAEIVRERLLTIRGIGPWTVNYTLLRGFGWLDGSLHGDAAVRRGMQRLPGAPETVSETWARDWLESFKPWRALVAAHLWQSLATGE